MALCVILGLWQLNRAHEKEQLITQYTQQKPVTLTGNFDNQHNFLLDNQIEAHQVGFHILTPFYSEGKIVLVNRGWIALGKTRAELPAIPKAYETTITGMLREPSNTIILKETVLTPPWPIVVQTIEIDKLEKLLGKEISDEILLVDPKTWQPTTLSPERHYGYAVQWFALAIALILLALWSGVRR